MADTSDDGRIGEKEFKRYILETIYAEADANRDKKITFEEWKEANPDADKGKFRLPDRNSDGSITPEEVKRYFDRTGDLEELFNKIDANNDGYVTPEEAEDFKAKSDTSGTKMQNLSRAINQ